MNDDSALEQAKKLGHKTISGQDVMKALEEMEFGDFVPDITRLLDGQYITIYYYYYY